jgi:hypothetical protein
MSKPSSFNGTFASFVIAASEEIGCGSQAPTAYPVGRAFFGALPTRRTAPDSDSPALSGAPLIRARKQGCTACRRVQRHGSPAAFFFVRPHGADFCAASILQSQSQRVNAMKQNVFTFLSIVPGIDLLSEELIERCKTFQEALGVSRAMGRRKMTDGALADTLGLQRSVWSRIQHKPKDSPAYMPEDKLDALCRALGNAGVIQWLASRIGCRLVPISESRADRLRRELAELEAEAVA